VGKCGLAMARDTLTGTTGKCGKMKIPVKLPHATNWVTKSLVVARVVAGAVVRAREKVVDSKANVFQSEWLFWKTEQQSKMMM